MFDFKLKFENGLDIQISEYLKDEDTPTYVYQLKEFLKSELECSYDDLTIFLLINGRKIKVSDDYEIIDNDEFIVKINQTEEKIGENEKKEKKEMILPKSGLDTLESLEEMIDILKQEMGIFKEKREYEGNLKNGYGKLKKISSRNNYSIYEGYFQDSEYHGFGKQLIYENGELTVIDEGYWENGGLEGFGIHEEIGDFRYEGNMLGGTFNGSGKIIYSNDEIYEGNFDCDYRQGYGKMTFENGNIYEGNWNSDRISGYGKMTYSNGDVYEGEWITDSETYKEMKNGHSKMTYSNGEIYEGNWLNDDFDKTAT